MPKDIYITLTETAPRPHSNIHTCIHTQAVSDSVLITIRLPYLGKVQQLQKQTIHSYQYHNQCVQFLCPKNIWYGCQWQCLWFFNVHTDDDAHEWLWGLYRQHKTKWVCTETVQVDSGRKILCCTGDSNLNQRCTWLFNWMLCQLSYPHPQWHGEVKKLFSWTLEHELHHHGHQMLAKLAKYAAHLSY